MRLLHPLWLLSAIPVGLAGLWLVRARGAGGRPVAFILRALSLALIVLALTQPQIGSGSAGHVVLAIDRSLSIEEGGSESAIERAWLTAAASEGCGEACPIVQFAGVPELTNPSKSLLAVRAGAPLYGERTDLEKALALALARASVGGQVVLLSDGRQTAGEAGSVLAQARAKDVRIDVVPLLDERPDLAVTRLQAPPALHAGDPFSLQFTLTSTLSAEVEISLKVNGRAAGTPRKEHLEVGETSLALEEKAPPGQGSYAYEVSVAPAGGKFSAGSLGAKNDSLARVVQVQAQPRVLVAGPEAPSFAGQLAAGGLQASVTEPGALPVRASEYGEEDAVVLTDVSAAELGETRAQALSEAVKEGRVGLFVLGGPHSFSLGNYYHSPLETLLPVRSLVPGNVKGAIALQLVLDHSGSMENLAGEYPKIEMAQTASRVAAKALAKHQDQLGLVAFNIKPQKVIPLEHVTKGTTLRHIERTIDGLQAEGGTNIDRGLAAGVRELEKSKVPDRHIVLMTDGESEEPGSYKQLLPKLHKEHITVSTIALGDQADTKLLEAIAHETGGEYFRVDEAGELPAIFSKQTRLSARPVRLRGKQIPVSPGEPSPVLESIRKEPLPALQGNVATALKEGAQADLLSRDVHGEHKSDPALAQWQYGVGRVLTWTPGIGSEWASAWAGKPALWQDAVRWVERGASLSALTPVVAAGDQEELEVDTVRNAGVELETPDLRGELGRKGEQPHPLRFTQTAPSRYLAALPAHLAPGVYEYATSDGSESSGGQVAIPYSAEYEPTRSDRTALGSLAAATGGEVLGANGEGLIRSSWTALWPWLTLAALVAFLADVALRMLGGGPPSAGSRLRSRRARPAGPPRREDRELARS